MSVVVPHCPIELAIDLSFSESFDLQSQSVAKISKLFSNGGGGRGLPVRVCEHGVVSPFLADLAKLLY